MNISRVPKSVLVHVTRRQYCSQVNKDGAYKRALQKNPLLMQSMQTGALMGTGDLLAQVLIEKKRQGQLNLRRTLQFVGMGLVIGPGLRFWYGFMDQRLKGRTPAIKSLKKVLLDQLGTSPIFLATFISVMGALQGEDVQGIKKKLKTEYKDVLFTNYYIWPWIQMANFTVVPLNYQVLVVQVVAIFWNIYLSWKTNHSVEAKAVKHIAT